VAAQRRSESAERARGRWRDVAALTEILSLVRKPTAKKWAQVLKPAPVLVLQEKLEAQA
jgi:hypothetical protein